MIVVDRINVITAQTVGIIGVVFVMSENRSAVARYKFVETTNRSNPKNAMPVAVHCEDEIVAQALRVLGIVLVVGEFFSFSIKFIKASVDSSNPKCPITIFEQSPDVVVTQAIGIIRIVLVKSETVAIIFVQALVCANPEKPFAILKYGNYCSTRKAVFNGDMLKLDRSVLGIQAAR